ncbi:hypothetical protein SAMN06297129_2271 [Pseudooceanicola antarcticus]|uniref:Uncharacterized protein n=1 Tax=Pseudooceanicola antarcticus TaxID=1247613 RepID=A0A285IZ20_9RHOB|nr:hypothetical protein [Pseudooceanicola antarcticus]PJE25929.1 hypothetical protein CVM39_19720 [Pseudooceanicola antarcticus]SNY52336.1 hypothetical protein SAMN06297129_2271 [Pseudooceanicola antarcticus]
MLRSVLILLALFVPAHLARSQEAPPLKPVECYCTDSRGARIELGETICMSVGGRSFLAQCQMSLNNPMWREVGPSCLSSRNLETERGASPPSASG